MVLNMIAVTSMVPSTVTNKYSFYNDDDDYILYNAGPVHLGTFAYTVDIDYQQLAA